VSEHDLWDYRMDTIFKIKIGRNNPGNPVILKSCSRQWKKDYRMDTIKR